MFALSIQYLASHNLRRSRVRNLAAPNQHYRGCGAVVARLICSVFLHPYTTLQSKICPKNQKMSIFPVAASAAPSQIQLHRAKSTQQRLHTLFYIPTQLHNTQSVQRRSQNSTLTKNNQFSPPRPRPVPFQVQIKKQSQVHKIHNQYSLNCFTYVMHSVLDIFSIQKNHGNAEFLPKGDSAMLLLFSK